jgi:hypothetical protein
MDFMPGDRTIFDDDISKSKILRKFDASKGNMERMPNGTVGSIAPHNPDCRDHFLLSGAICDCRLISSEGDQR